MQTRLSSAGAFNIGLWLSGMFLLAAAALLVLPQFAMGQEDEAGKSASSQTTKPNPLDGLQFKAGIVRAGDGGDTSGLEDTLMFDNGEFSSVVCKRYNFSSAPYWIRQEGNQTHFLAELTSPTDGKMVWQGTIHEGKLEGTMRWTRKRWYWTVDAEHNIRGEMKEDTVD